jgi:anti-sigma-K factor RskA
MNPVEHDDTRWAELAAGYALHALEPDEEQTFASHLAGCAICRATLDEHSLVAAQLASLVDDAATAAPSWSRIRPALGDVVTLPEDARDEVARADNDVAVRRLRPRHTRLLAAAAAVVGLVGVGFAGWQLAGRSDTHSPSSAVAACRTGEGCHVVRLLADGSKVEAGDVLVQGGSASVVPTAMPALDSTHVYVLWQLPRDGRPTPVTALQHVETSKASRSVPLVIPYADTAGFAMSVEPADQVPTRPTKVVAMGAAT